MDRMNELESGGIKFLEESKETGWKQYIQAVTTWRDAKHRCSKEV